ncbi:MAG TPA: hypothetical protein VGU20_05730 [Stellaceae bacterium]|nr:hypothetical protein [Stellaceae bacterium]
MALRLTDQGWLCQREAIRLAHAYCANPLPKDQFSFATSSRSLARLKSYDPALVVDLGVDLLAELRDRFERGRFDAVIIRHDKERRDGQLLFREPMGWFAGPRV